MIKVTGRDNGKGVWMNVVGITTRGRQEVARIPRSTLSRIIKVKDGEMGCVSVDVLRDIGVNAGFYRKIEGCRGLGMWVEPRIDDVPHEQDNPTIYYNRLKDMYRRGGVRVDMRALRKVLDVAAMLGAPTRDLHIMAKAGYWMLADTASWYAIVKEKDDALMVAHFALEMEDVRFYVDEVEDMWADVVAPPFDAPEWDINGHGRLCLWIDETGGARLGDISGGGEIAYSSKALRAICPSTGLAYAMPADEWMERYAVWKEAVAVKDRLKAGDDALWKARQSVDVVVLDGLLELGVTLLEQPDDADADEK